MEESIFFDIDNHVTDHLSDVFSALHYNITELAPPECTVSRFG